MDQTLLNSQLSAPRRYEKLGGDIDYVYSAMCRVLSGRKGEVDWGRFSPDEWRSLARMSQPDAEGVGPLLYWHFKDGTWPEEMPLVVREHLTKSYYNTLAQNTLMYKELARILETFAAEEIPVIVLKGAALAATVYEDIGLRPMGDLDLLVRPEDLRRAWKAMSALNYQVLAANTEVVLRNFDGPEIGVDLHWCIVSGYETRSAEIDWFAVDLVDFEVPFSEVNGVMLEPSVHLAYLISHTVDQELLRAFYDIHTLSSMREIQTEEIQSIVEKASWNHFLFIILRSVQKRFQPTAVTQDLLMNETGKQALTPVTRTNVIIKAWKKIEFRTLALILLRIFFPTRKYLEWRYRRPISNAMPLWMVNRWLDLIKDITLTKLKAIVSKGKTTLRVTP